MNTFRRYGVVVALIAACIGMACAPAQTAPSGATARATATQASAATGAITAQIASSEIVVGENRFVLGLLDSSGKPVADATAHLTFYDLTGGQPVSKGETDATFRAPARDAGLSETISVTLPNGQKRIQTNAPSDVGIYEARATFDRAGNWGVEASGKLRSGAPYVARSGFKVTEKADTPAIGAPAPRSHNLTVKDVKDLAQIDTSAVPSPDMHTLSIADGIEAGRPLLILFASPGYCSSRFCGPELEIARKLESKYRDRVDFIHVEIYKDPGQRIPVDAVNEWHLPSEPWFFIVDNKGIVRAKFEGPTAMQELDAALQKVSG